ncbi:hypothetical protein R6258_13800 [Halomonas sp. HP20-15]|uniref:hypothetical protein n=1 Tax=Halomonas sp. HP20-15 TaxID=3085901 RepID=UPI00298162AF|nr:hypothetical protein [Halomonas sp. HP20-15]MDW5377996.1 hypothetical protein [Halomonas sp. HP20-15]
MKILKLRIQVIRIILALGASLLLVACSSISYKEPTGGDRARVRFVTETESVMVIRGYDDSSCMTNEREWMRLRKGFLFNSQPKRLGIPLWSYHKNAAKEVYVTTGKNYTFLFSGSEQGGALNYSCGVPITVRFKSGHDYELYFKWDVRDYQKCTVSFGEIVSDGLKSTFNTLSEQKNIVTAATSGCMEVFTKPRLY